ncbi:MAG: transporter associated domain-containing protein, partial [Candidatus Acidiferrales bacterium]
GGFVLNRLGFIPRGGESFEADGFRFTVMEMEHRRVSRVKIKPLTVPAASAAASAPEAPAAPTAEQKNMFTESAKPGGAESSAQKKVAAKARRGK